MPAGAGLIAGTRPLVTPATTAAAPIPTVSPTPAPPSTPESLTMPRTCLDTTDAIEADMPEALARIHPNQCGYISMITGPSRTADIERVLTIGVHGPSRLVIVFVDELGRN